MADGLRTVAAQHDPVGRVLNKTVRDNGLEITKVSVPFGVIGIIYEARPNVTADAAGICIKAGNAVILRGGKESIYSSSILAEIFRMALRENGVDENAVQLVENPDHALVSLLLQKNDEIDLVIPRGGERLIRAVVEQSKIPVIKHFNGICHVYVDKSADMEKALAAAPKDAKLLRRIGPDKGGHWEVLGG